MNFNEIHLKIYKDNLNTGSGLGDLFFFFSLVFIILHFRSSVPTVGKQSTVIGNGVSLTRLLRNCSLALIQFFDKAKKWADMNNLNETFVKKIEKLNRNFVVSHVIFKKFQPIFLHLFKDPALNPPRVKTSRKQKRGPCTTTDIFDFCWTLFVQVKSEFSGISDDLVNSYHLLLSCIDYIHANAVIGMLNIKR